jgi:hypothetical protein
MQTSICRIKNISHDIVWYQKAIQERQTPSTTGKLVKAYNVNYQKHVARRDLAIFRLWARQTWLSKDIKILGFI